MNTIPNHIHYHPTKLFLDDVRTLNEVFEYTKEPIYTFPNWDIVRSFDEFTKYITKNGAPIVVSFDHDLADVHYALHNDYPDPIDRQTEWVKYHKDETHEKTGYDCLKWLIDYCHDNMFTFPKIYIHTMNTVGRNNMAYFYNSAVRNKFIKLT